MRHDIEYQNHKNRQVQLIQETESDRLVDMQRTPANNQSVSSGSGRFWVAIAVLTVLLAGQPAQAQNVSADVPPWVRDRQQYETRYVYSPETDAIRKTPNDVLLWVRHRQQYETTYEYHMPLAKSDGAEVATSARQ